MATLFDVVNWPFRLELSSREMVISKSVFQTENRCVNVSTYVQRNQDKTWHKSKCGPSVKIPPLISTRGIKKTIIITNDVVLPVWACYSPVIKRHLKDRLVWRLEEFPRWASEYSSLLRQWACQTSLSGPLIKSRCNIKSRRKGNLTRFLLVSSK